MLTLVGANFTAARKAHPRLLVEFYAPWCSHCNHIAPQFAAAADKLAKDKIPARLAKVDAIEEEELATKLDIDTYPTFLWFDDAESPSREYRGGRKSAEMAAWVQRRVRTGTGGEVIESAEAAAKWAIAAVEPSSAPGGASLSVLLLLPPGCPPGLLEAYGGAARSADSAFFSHTYSPKAFSSAVKLAQQLVTKERTRRELSPVLAAAAAAEAAAAAAAAEESLTQPAALILKAHDERFAVSYRLLGDVDDASSEAAAAALSGALDELVSRHALPLLVPFTDDFEDALYSGPIRTQLIVFGTGEMLAAATATLEAVAAAHRGRAAVVLADIDIDASDGLMVYFKLDTHAHEYLQCFGFDVDTEQQYSPPAKLAAFSPGSVSKLEPTLNQFVDQLLAGEAKPVRVSEDAPKTNDGPMTIVVADTFDQIVRREGRTVMLQIHATWCGHCKALVVEYEYLAKRYKDLDNVTIAMMDGTVNEVPGLEYDGYPTLLLYTATNQVFEAGEDVERTADALAAFIETHADEARTRTPPEGAGEASAKEEL